MMQDQDQEETRIAVSRTVPPQLSIQLPKLRDLPSISQDWTDVELPVDILLLTVENCEFLACYTYLRSPFKSYHKELGHVYFGNVGEDNPLKVALLKCLDGSSGPGGSLTVVSNAVVHLRPKVIYSVGCCIGLNQENTQIGDVVVSSKLTTEAFRTPMDRDIGNLIKHAGDGWKPPIEGPETLEVNVHCAAEIFSGIDNDTANRHHELYPQAIAVEMEGKGIFAAAHDLQVNWVIVKGVSGFFGPGGTLDVSWKRFACVMAASVVFHMLTDTVVFEQWPHYQGSSTGSVKIPGVDLPVREQSAVAAPNKGLSGPQPSSDLEKKRCGANEEDEPSGEKFDLDRLIRLIVSAEDLDDEQKKVLYAVLTHNGQEYLKYRKLSGDVIEQGVDFFEYLTNTYKVNLVCVAKSSLEIVINCPTLESLEHLWRDHLSGHFTEVAERLLVTV